MSTSPLQGPIADTVKTELYGTLYDVTFVKVSETYDPQKGQTTTTTTDYTCRGFIGEFGKNVVSDGLAKQTDAKFVILQETLTDNNGNKIEPSGEDQIKHDSTTYSVIQESGSFGIQQDPASATWEIQARA